MKNKKILRFICLPRTGQKNPLYDPQVEINRVQHGKNINFTRVVVTLALLWHQTSHPQNKFFFICLHNILLSSFNERSKSFQCSF